MRGRTATVLVAVLLAVSGCRSEPVEAPVIRGITLPSWYRSDYDSRAADRYLRDIRATGADWVTFTPTWYQKRRGDSVIRRTEETAGDAGLRRIVRRAHAHGLKVMIKPHVDLPGDIDRAEIRPRDRAAWFISYRRFITHYADLAAATGTEQFAVGTELAGVSADRAAWTGIITTIRDRYDGTLTYAANYDEYRRVAFWSELDLIGIDAYWPLADRPTHSAERLRKAWQPISDRLAAYSREQNRRILFTEAGYVSQRGTTTAPYDWTVSDRPDPAEQAAAYRALLDTFTGRPWWAGVHWWMWDDWPDSAETPARLAYTPHGKPAEKVLRQRWAAD
ncbi:glycoside hydrolase TIM-barrel-like domain-containing protein [Streptomyces cinnabarinus]|uniref:Glycoside hydrolase TIM-barrel-like domain-containing protein n=1 Tax=Streptomyces cinnabarinus TaxID=67287 RepID=A0ABY7KBD9_9ACTN|nr:glycoside hydrolase TIM-barrel-like domain-containing protein [Streptomyces cinnabarinus]WAZ21070.1 glycoside hydrolase TIM-barrel-like domain-containing protein [Streptomyces cinnabarinus]